MYGYTEELKKTFVDHQPSAKTLITLHVMFSAIFSTVYIREIMIYYLNGETDLYQQKKSIFASTVCNSFFSLVKPSRYFLRVSQKDWKYWKFTIIDDISLTSIFTSLHHWKAWIWCQSPSILDPIDIGRRISRRSTVQKSRGAFFHHFQFRVSGYTREARGQISFCSKRIVEPVKLTLPGKSYLINYSYSNHVPHPTTHMTSHRKESQERFSLFYLEHMFVYAVHYTQQKVFSLVFIKVWHNNAIIH